MFFFSQIGVVAFNSSRPHLALIMFSRPIAASYNTEYEVCKPAYSWNILREQLLLDLRDRMSAMILLHSSYGKLTSESLNMVLNTLIRGVSRLCWAL